ncbi:MAG: protein-disulfide reductase DsbD family protein [Fimbriimonas sp.]|nr:protein-disulfide reductase DsbD family protein [Fimbriimonas sp.]
MAPLPRLSLVVSIGVVSAISFAQMDTPPVVKLKVGSPVVLASKPFKATLSVTFGPGLHAYQNPPSDPTNIPITVKAGDKVFKVLSVSYPKGVAKAIPAETKAINVYSGTIQIPITLQAPAKTGRLPIEVSLGYQQCTDQSCFPPSSVTAKATVIISSKSGKGMPPPTKFPYKTGG